MASVKQTCYVSMFRCLGAECEDTCCQGWGMQVNDAVFKRYETRAPELLDAVVSGEAEHVMRRDDTTDFCVNLMMAYVASIAITAVIFWVMRVIFIRV